MTREQAKQNLVTIGIAEPTDEQITNYLNQINGESKALKDRADRFKADADKVGELQKKLDDMQNANLTDLQKAQKDAETAAAEVAKLQSQIARMNLVKAVSEKAGISSDDAEKLLGENGSLNLDVLAEVISKKENDAATRKEQEIAQTASNPGGAQNTGKDEKPEDVKSVEGIVFNGASDTANKDFYKL